MGIRFSCPNGHKLNVKEFLAGKRGVCPQCGAKFIIPMPGDMRASSTPPTGAVAQSHSVEIVSPAPSRATSIASSPSIIISIAETEHSISQMEPAADATGAHESVAAAAASLAAPPAPPTVTEPVEAPAEILYPTRLPRSRRNQLTISIVLMVLVIVLAVVLIWVLKRDVGDKPGGKAKAIFSPIGITRIVATD